MFLFLTSAKYSTLKLWDNYSWPSGENSQFFKIWNFFSSVTNLALSVRIRIHWTCNTQMILLHIFLCTDELASLSTRQKVNILLITPDAADGHSRGPELQKFLTNSDVYDITLTVRTPQKHEQAVIESASSVEEIDQQIGIINYFGNQNYRLKTKLPVSWFRSCVRSCFICLYINLVTVLEELAGIIPNRL